jgi:glycosyltransferase involved in cell wall biosynthesis
MIIGHSYLAEENRKQLDRLAEEMALEVVSPSAFQGMIFNYDLGCRFIEGRGWRIHLCDKWVPPRFPEAAYLLRSLDLGLRRFRPDIVHVEGDPFTPFFVQTFLLTRLLAPRARVVATVKQNTYTSRGPLRDGAKDALTRFLVPRVHRFITVNRGVADLYRTRFGAKPEQLVSCTHLGVDTQTFAPPGTERVGRFGLHRGGFLVGYAGRLVDYKGIPDLVEATEVLRRETAADVRLALLGDGPLRGPLLESARERTWIQVLDPVPHARVAEFLQELDLFVMPPRVLRWHEEHDAHALLEAMASGVPCIGSICGAIGDVLPKAGVLVKPEDPSALAAAMRRLLNDTGMREAFAMKGRERVVQNYSLEAVARRHRAVYREVLSLAWGIEAKARKGSA